MEIPIELQPHPAQTPSYITNDEQMHRWKLCFAITRAIAQRDDPVFARELFFGPMKTGDPDDPPAAGAE